MKKSSRSHVRSLSAYLKQKRQESGYTQMDVALKIGHSTPQYISNYERGLCEPSIEMSVKIGRMLGVTPKDIRDVLLTAYSAYVKKALKL